MRYCPGIYFFILFFMNNKEIKPNYWSVYKAINFRRFSKTREFIDTDSGKTMSYSFGKYSEEFNFWTTLCGMILWSSPAFLIVIISTSYAQETLWSFLFGVLALVGYHFLGMYYVIRGPFIEYHQESKIKRFFGL